MHESDDILRSTGLLTLGTRFRRLGERLQAETQVVLGEAAMQVPVASHPLLNLLDRRGPQQVGQISEALGVTQPGITRAVASLSKSGMVAIRPSDSDGRIRVVSLTEDGTAFVAKCRAEVWPRVERAVADLCDGFAAELLDHLDRIEDGLADRPLSRRTGGTE